MIRTKIVLTTAARLVLWGACLSICIHVGSTQSLAAEQTVATKSGCASDGSSPCIKRSDRCCNKRRRRRCRVNPCCGQVPASNQTQQKVVAKGKTKVKAKGNIKSKAKSKTRTLFNGKTLDGWKITKFGGEGEVLIKEQTIQLDFGASMTGITYKGEVPKSNYEISLEAMRVDGVDFFCALTFPVAESHCSFIVGGWGGAVVGLSSLNGQDASANETTQYMKFNSGQWYKIRVRVTDGKIETWIDDKKVVDQDISEREISTRIEVDLSKPLGVAAWQTKAALRKITIRELSAK